MEEYPEKLYVKIEKGEIIIVRLHPFEDCVIYDLREPETLDEMLYYPLD